MIEADVYGTEKTDASNLVVARSAVAGKLIFVISGEAWPASMYLPAVLDAEEVTALRDALTAWLQRVT